MTPPVRLSLRLSPKLIPSGVGNELKQAAVWVAEVDAGSVATSLSSGGRSTKMISDGRSDANRKVLIKGLGENLLPTAQPWGPWWPCPLVAAPGTGNRHIDLFCHLTPGQALVTQLHDMIGGGGMCGRT